jgi:hypothetical protein
VGGASCVKLEGEVSRLGLIAQEASAVSLWKDESLNM